MSSETPSSAADSPPPDQATGTAPNQTQGLPSSAPAQHGPHPNPLPQGEGGGKARLGQVIGVLAIGALVVLAWRVMSKPGKAEAVADSTGNPMPVAVARITREDLYNEVPIPAEFRPYLEVELHAKVSGYVDQMYVDIGDRVKAGQLLATLEVPELRDEHARALATEKRAVADYKDAHLVYTRLMSVEKDHPNLVAQQDLDAAEARDSTTEAAIGAAKADRERYETLLAYTKITAPFDGVITRRYADPGALIQSGISSDTQSMPLVRLSNNYRLRLDFPVSVAYVKDIHVGDRVEVRVESLGNKTFTGIISRDTDKVDDETRTLRTEIEVENPNLELVPGMYAEALLKVQRRPQTLSVPIEAISFEHQPSVYLVNQSQEIEERPVTLGLETPTRYEILGGLREGDLVMIGGRSKVKLGQKVAVKLTGSLAQQ